MFDIGETSHFDKEADVPDAVKRVHKISTQPIYMKHMGGADVKQGKLNNCWYVAGLTALANLEEVGVDAPFSYQGGTWAYTVVDDTLCLQSPNWDPGVYKEPFCNRRTESTPRATTKRPIRPAQKPSFLPNAEIRTRLGDYAALTGGWVGEGLEDLSGGVITELFISDILYPDVFWPTEVSKDSPGQRLLKLRNPWAYLHKGIWEGAWSDGSKEWTAEA
ncbi:Peptidase C2, calpain family [Fusarium oxysporum f. sp. vasinfectum]|nr:Peptidase C2, calpain family [Fusarium oxysporum f. sp. vasinfectum]